MPRMYTVSAENLAITTGDGDVDLVELDAATDKPIALVGWRITVLTEVQEAQEEWARLKIIRGHTTSGSTPTATPTPAPLSPNDAAAGFTAEVYNATIASAGTAVDLDPLGVQVRAGENLILPGGMEYWTSGSSLLVVRLMAALADAANLSMVFWVIEYP